MHYVIFSKQLCAEFNIIINGDALKSRVRVLRRNGRFLHATGKSLRSEFCP